MCISLADACICNSRKEGKKDVKRRRRRRGRRIHGVVFQLPMYSCRDVFAIVCTSHKFGSTGYI